MRNVFIFTSFIFCLHASHARVATEFAHNVDQGVAKVSVPIELPKGNANLTPSLSIEYQSSNGQGGLGQGWAISGLGEIKVCAMTTFIDGTLSGANVDDAFGRKVFCLNGKRLIQVGQFGSVPASRNANATEIQFRTEIETFSKAVAFVRYEAGDSSWGKVVGWRVWEKNGLVTEYGFPEAPSFGSAATSNTLVEANGKAIVWLKSRVLDTSGNSIVYKYIGGATETRRISEIQYGANIKASVALPNPHTLVSFDWDPAPFPVPTATYSTSSIDLAGQNNWQITPTSKGFGLHGNAYVSNSHYLSAIKTSTKVFNLVNTTSALIPVKHYRFAYNYDNQFGAERGETNRFLKSIQECQPGGFVCTDLSPVEFLYETGVPYFEVGVNNYLKLSPANSAAIPNPGAASFLDLNNDGVADFCSVRSYVDSPYGSFIPILQRLRCNLGTKADTLSADGSAFGFTDPTADLIVRPVELGFVEATDLVFLGFGDVSGDGVPDVCFSAYVQDRRRSVSRSFGVRCLEGRGNGSFQGVLNPLGVREAEVLNKQPNVDVAPGFWLPPTDMNFDGILDFCQVRRNGQDPEAVVCYVSDRTNPLNSISGRARAVIPSNLLISLTPALSDSFFLGQLMLVDLNGDGLTDICVPNVTSGVTQCVFLKDNGKGIETRYTFTNPLPLIPGAPSAVNLFVTNALSEDSEMSTRWVDVNGDSIADLCIHTTTNVFVSKPNNIPWRNKLACFLGDGTGQFVYDAQRFGIWELPALELWGRSFIDINQDGKVDFCGVKTNGILINSPNLGRSVVCYPMISSTAGGAFIQPAPIPTELGNLSNQFVGNHNAQIANEPVVGSNGYSPLSDGMTFAKLGGRSLASFCRFVSNENFSCIQIRAATSQLQEVRGQLGSKAVKFNYEYLPRYSGYSSVGNAIGSTYASDPARVEKSIGIASELFKAPLIASTPVVSIVTSVTETVFGQGTKTAEYGYKNYVFDLINGRGALGFEATSIKTPTKAADNVGPAAFTTIITKQHLQWPRTGKPYSITTLAPNGAVIKQVSIQIGESKASASSIVDSTCGQISRPSLNFPWPIVIGMDQVSTENWNPILNQSNARQFVSNVRTSESDYDACGNPRTVDVSHFSEREYSVIERVQPPVWLGFSQTKQSTFYNVTDQSNGVTSRWFIGQPRTQTTVFKVPDSELSPPQNVAAMPSANSLLNPPPPLPPSSPNTSALHWLPAVLNMLLN